MSTPDADIPGELRLGSLAASDVGRGGTPPAATPGVGAGVTRIPTAPTLPDADTASLTLAVSRIANELFAADSAALLPSISTSDAGSPPASGSPPAQQVPSPAHEATATPKVPAPSAPSSSELPRDDAAPRAEDAAADRGHPFSSPLDFDGVRLDHDAPEAEVFSLPLVDRLPATPPQQDPAVPAPSRTDASVVQVDSSLSELHPFVDLSPRDEHPGFDAASVRREFPILEERVHRKRLVWLDNAATTQKPREVIQRLKTFYERENSNIHRAAHTLAARATDAYEAARESVRRFVNARSVRDVVFVRGATEGINLVAQSWGRRNVGAGDEIVITHLEHHANIVPWQMLAAEKGAKLRVAPVDDRGQILLDEYEKLLNDRTRIVALSHVSNALGTVTPAREMIEIARRRGIRTLLDGAQSVSHLRVDVQRLGCDWFVFSGHKVFGPTGIGAVVAPAELLDETPPWQGGGNMIEDVTFERTVYQKAPARFEAGTGNIADAVGLGTALDWLDRIGLENVERHEHDLLVYGTEALQQVPGLRIIGTAAEKAGVLSFVLAGHETSTLSSYLDREGIAVRGGHHCAQPILRRFGLESTVRASLALYNTRDDLDALVAALCRIAGSQGARRTEAQWTS